MGWGDELMAAGQARKVYEQTGRAVQIVGVDRRPRWSELWQGIPYIVGPGARAAPNVILNGPNARPYVASKTAERWHWQPFQPTPAQVSLQASERALGQLVAGAVVIEPTIKDRASPNKAWVPGRWAELVAAMPDIKFVQLGPLGIDLLLGARHVPTRSFREAMGALSGAGAYVGPEGGLHHAAAAVGIPAVVLFGGFIAPENTGYKEHRNLFTGGYACGSRLPCAHCKKAMNDITVQMAADNLREVLRGKG
jgi:hypothetical protein